MKHYWTNLNQSIVKDLICEPISCQSLVFVINTHPYPILMHHTPIYPLSYTTYITISYTNTTYTIISYANATYTTISYTNTTHTTMSCTNTSYTTTSYANTSYTVISYTNTSYTTISCTNTTYTITYRTNQSQNTCQIITITRMHLYHSKGVVERETHYGDILRCIRDVGMHLKMNPWLLIQQQLPNVQNVTIGVVET